MPDIELLSVINTIRDNKRQPLKNELQPGLRLREDLDFESLDLAELTARIDDKFGIDVFADGLVYTIGEIVEKIRRGRASQIYDR